MVENEKIILEAVAQGDEDRFKEIFDYYYPKVKVFLMQFISNPDDAMDIAQNIFIKIWLQRSCLSEIRSFGAFLYTMTRNADVVEKSDDEYETENGFYAKEIEVQVAHLIKQMPDRRRKVFILSRFEGKSNSEIAQIMGISKKTVENHMNLVLKELRKITKVIAIFF